MISYIPIRFAKFSDLLFTVILHMKKKRFCSIPADQYSARLQKRLFFLFFKLSFLQMFSEYSQTRKSPRLSTTDNFSAVLPAAYGKNHAA